MPGHVGLQVLQPGHQFAASVSLNQLVRGFDGCQFGEDPPSHLVNLAHYTWLLDGVGESYVIAILDNLFFDNLVHFLVFALVTHWWCSCDDKRIKVFLN